MALPPAMTNLEPSLVVQCFEFIQSIASQKVGKFSFKLTIGHSQFSFDSREEGTSARNLPAGVEQCHKTPSKMRRNARRREQFLKKKLSSPISPPSYSGTSMTSHPDPDISSAGLSEKGKAVDGDTKTSRLKSREEGRKFGYITRRISALTQQIELNRRCIGMSTVRLGAVSSTELARYGINEDELVRDDDSGRFRLPPEKCSFQEPSQSGKEAEIHEDSPQCEMCYKPMSLDHQC